MSIAFLFPGQGAQRPGFLHALPEHPVVQRVLAEADTLLGHSVLELDSEEALRSTVSVQLSLYVSGVAVGQALRAEGVEPEGVAGLSVGAFAAAVICNSLDFQDGWRLVRQRAQAMEHLYPVGYGLSAIVGLREQQVVELIRKYHTEAAPVYLGNINAPQQIVIAGSIEGMEKVLSAAKEKGARKAERLHVSVPSHCALLSSVARELETTLQDIEILPPSVPYLSNRRARPLRKPEAICEDLATNIEHPVRWHDASCVLSELGVDTFLEMPPGHTLTSLAKEAFPDSTAVAVGEMPLSYIIQRFL